MGGGARGARRIRLAAWRRGRVHRVAHRHRRVGIHRRAVGEHVVARRRHARIGRASARSGIAARQSGTRRQHAGQLLATGRTTGRQRTRHQGQPRTQRIGQRDRFGRTPVGDRHGQGVVQLLATCHQRAIGRVGGLGHRGRGQRSLHRARRVARDGRVARRAHARRARRHRRGVHYRTGRGFGQRHHVTTGQRTGRTRRDRRARDAGRSDQRIVHDHVVQRDRTCVGHHDLVADRLAQRVAACHRRRRGHRLGRRQRPDRRGGHRGRIRRTGRRTAQGVSTGGRGRVGDRTGIDILLGHRIGARAGRVRTRRQRAHRAADRRGRARAAEGGLVDLQRADRHVARVAHQERVRHHLTRRRHRRRRDRLVQRQRWRRLERVHDGARRGLAIGQRQLVTRQRAGGAAPAAGRVVGNRRFRQRVDAGIDRRIGHRSRTADTRDRGRASGRQREVADRGGAAVVVDDRLDQRQRRGLVIVGDRTSRTLTIGQCQLVARQRAGRATPAASDVASHRHFRQRVHAGAHRGAGYRSRTADTSDRGRTGGRQREVADRGGAAVVVDDGLDERQCCRLVVIGNGAGRGVAANQTDRVRSDRSAAVLDATPRRGGVSRRATRFRQRIRARRYRRGRDGGAACGT